MAFPNGPGAFPQCHMTDGAADASSFSGQKFKSTDSSSPPSGCCFVPLTALVWSNLDQQTSAQGLPSFSSLGATVLSPQCYSKNKDSGDQKQTFQSKTGFQQLLAKLGLPKSFLEDLNLLFTPNRQIPLDPHITHGKLQRALNFFP